MPWECSFFTIFAAFSGDGVLQVTRGDKLTVIYDDPADDFGNPVTVEDVAFYNVTLKSGPLSDSETWGVDNSPYLVTGDVTVGSGMTLTVSPGVEVFFQEVSDDQSSGSDANRSEIIIDDGSLIAVGTASDSIWFTSNAENPASSDWYGFSCKDQVGVIDLQYVSASYMTNGFKFQYWTYFKGNQGDYLNVSHSHFRDIASYVFSNGVYLEYGTFWTLENNRFSRFTGFQSSYLYLYTGAVFTIDDNVLEDIVRAIRSFRPLTIISIYHGSLQDGHGHHQAAGILAREAYKISGDPNQFPQLINQGLLPWKAQQFYVVNKKNSGDIQINTGRYNPVLGLSYKQIGALGYSLHRSQGMGHVYALPGSDSIALKLIEKNNSPFQITSNTSSFETFLNLRLSSLADLFPKYPTIPHII